MDIIGPESNFIMIASAVVVFIAIKDWRRGMAGQQMNDLPLQDGVWVDLTPRRVSLQQLLLGEIRADAARKALVNPVRHRGR